MSEQRTTEQSYRLLLQAIWKFNPAIGGSGELPDALWDRITDVLGTHDNDVAEST